MTGWILITAGAVLCTLVFSGIYFTSMTRRKVSYMLDALEDKETNFRFREEKWPDRKFNRTLNRIRGIFEKEQAEILEQEKYFGKMLDNVQTGIVVISEGERIEYCNKKALSLLGMATFSTVRPRISALNAITSASKCRNRLRNDPLRFATNQHKGVGAIPQGCSLSLLLSVHCKHPG